MYFVFIRLICYDTDLKLRIRDIALQCMSPIQFVDSKAPLFELLNQFQVFFSFNLRFYIDRKEKV